jgi:peptidoglycan/LPS O-acetylase OafA/YrhL
LLIPNNVFFRVAGSSDAFPINPPLWSLFDEWIANIAYAAALYRLKTWHASALVGICWAVLFFFAWNSPVGWGATEISTGGIHAIAGFTAGVVIWRLFATGRLEFLPSVRPELVYVFWFVVASVPLTRPLPVFEFVAGTLGAVTAVALLARSDRPVSDVFAWLGAVSYPLYTSHIAVIRLAQAWAPSSQSAFLILPMVVAALILATAVHCSVTLVNSTQWRAVLTWVRSGRAPKRAFSG